MQRIWNSMGALVALATLLVPPHVCCVRLFAAAPAKAFEQTIGPSDGPRLGRIEITEKGKSKAVI